MINNRRELTPHQTIHFCMGKVGDPARKYVRRKKEGRKAEERSSRRVNEGSKPGSPEGEVRSSTADGCPR